MYIRHIPNGAEKPKADKRLTDELWAQLLAKVAYELHVQMFKNCDMSILARFKRG